MFNFFFNKFNLFLLLKGAFLGKTGSLRNTEPTGRGSGSGKRSVSLPFHCSESDESPDLAVRADWADLWKSLWKDSFPPPWF